MKVLFIGNSHTYFNDMPHLFAGMCERLTGEPTEVTMLAYSYRTLAWHCTEYFSVRFALMYGNYDYCVIQQFGHPVPPIEETEPFAERLIALCKKCGTKPILYATWAKKDEPENAALISGIYRTLAERYGALLAPIAELYAQLGAEHPEIDLYWHDGSHASPKGDYLIAATLAAIVCRPKDLSALNDCAIDFDVRFENGEIPSAAEKEEDAVIELDPCEAAVLRRCAERAIL